MEWYLKVIRDNYANFEGRARRQEFWMFYLFHIIIIFILAFVVGLMGGADGSFLPFIPLLLYFLATIVPMIAVSVRRLHDTGKSGWYYLVSFIPYVGGIILLVLLAIDGDKETNQYGPNPKAPSNEEINEIGQPLE